MIAILIGTRPELIKMAPVMRELDRKRLSYVFIHSNQHYSQNMDGVFISELKLRKPDFNLSVGSGSHAAQTGKIMEGVEKILQEIKPNIIVVHGDTNTTLSGALAAKKLQIAVGHIEAGLRSFDYKMPEEINRILVDRMSDILFAPTAMAKKNLRHEGIAGKQIIVTGNTVADAVLQHKGLAEQRDILRTIRLDGKDYILVTAHRPETVDSKENLEKLLQLLAHAHTTTKKALLWPMHPRTATMLRQFKLQLPAFVIQTEPLSYLDMLYVLQHAWLVMTDSGGLQEEAYILQKPLMTLRDSTERPETLSANFLVHLDSAAFDTALAAYGQKEVMWENKFGTGKAGQKIVAALETFLESLS